MIAPCTPRAVAGLVAALNLLGCGSSPPPARPEPAPLATADADEVPPPSHDPPEISRSRGVPGGVVVLWTRVIPRTTDPEITGLAGRLQGRLHGLVAATLPGRPIDLRPQPERVCPRAGCLGVSAGVLLVHDQRGCAAVALLGGSGPSATHLRSWIGKVRLKNVLVPFREPPESQVEVADYVPCAEAVDALAAGEPALEAALRELADRDTAAP